MRSSRSFSRRLAAALALAAAFAGCGKKGPPLPPLRHNPAAAQDLSVYQQGSEWILQASYPKTTVAGLALPGLEALEVWSMERPLPPAPPTPPAEAPPAAPTEPTQAPPEAAPAPAAAPSPPPVDPREFEAQAKLLRTLRGAEFESAVVGDKLQIRIPVMPTTTQATAFAIKTIAAGGDASSFSNTVLTTSAAAPAPPAGLATEPQAGGVEVSWQPAVPAPQAYRVYRRGAQERGYREPLHQAPAGETRFLDTTAKLGERYVYTVAAVASEAPLVLSPLSSESEVDYQDRFPPAPPAGLLALPEGTEIRLRWNAAAAEDTAGYIVYRQDPGGDFHRVNAEPMAALEYADSGLVPGNTYRYRVAAVDRAGNEGPPGDAVEGIVR